MSKRLIIIGANIVNLAVLVFLDKWLGFEAAVIGGLLMIMAYLVYRDVHDWEE